MQKTGSKAIQSFSRANADRLLALGFRYPSAFGDGAWHQDLFVKTSAKREERIARLLSRNRAVILSYEQGYVAPDALIASLARNASALHLFLIVREPISWMNSWINQVAKAHRATHQQFMALRQADAGLDTVLTIDRHLARWEAFTPREQITAVAYDHTRDVVAPYLDWLGISAADRSGLAPLTTPPNQALDGSGLRVFLEVKRLCVHLDYVKLEPVMRRAHQWLKNRPVAPQPEPFRLIDDATAAAILSRYQAGFDAVLERYGTNGEPPGFAQARDEILSRPVLTDLSPNADEAAWARAILAGETFGAPRL